MFLKSKNAMFIKWSILFSLIGILQSCFVVGVANGPLWSPDKNEDLRLITKSDSIPLEIGVNNPNTLIPIPFFFIVIDKKQYDISVTMKTSKYAIDSMTYKLTTINNHTIKEGVTYHKSEQSKTAKQIWINTDFIEIYKPDNKYDLMLEFNLFLHDEFGNIMIPKTVKLQREKPGWITISAFQ